MSADLDLTEAIEAAREFINNPATRQHVVEAAAPLIERQVRDRIAAEQTEYATRFDPAGPIRSACWQLIDIARGEQ